MPAPEIDNRSPGRRARDEELAAEMPLQPIDLAPNTVGKPIETHLRGVRRHPLAVEGIVENGLVRPVDPTVKLPEQSRVIIVAAGAVA
jgi:hypothetical protein